MRSGGGCGAHLVPGYTGDMNSTGQRMHVEREIRLFIDMFTKENSVLSKQSTVAFIVVYAILSTVAVVSNSVVMSAVLRNKKMRTARNIFIFNLAFSDLLLGLCLPFLIMTKLFVRTIPAAAAFMSSLTIITIAVDRLRVITMAHKSQIKPLGALMFLPVILVISSLLSAPVFVKSRLLSLDVIMEKVIKHPLSEANQLELENIKVCMEDWSDGEEETIQKNHRLGYTLVSVLFQYVLPLIIITVIYCKIYSFLRDRRMLNRILRKKKQRTCAILLSVSLMFCLSWLPFSIICVVSEIADLYTTSGDALLAYLACHVVGVSSSVTNPVLYGVLNYNFQQEFSLIARKLIRSLASCWQSNLFTMFTQHERSKDKSTEVDRF